MASIVSFDEDLQRAIQLSIQDLTFEQQFQIAQQESEREENQRKKLAAKLSQMSYEEQLRLAEQMSLKDAPIAPSRSFFAKHFEELVHPAPNSFPEPQVKPSTGRNNRRVKQLSSKASDLSSSDSDSGFGSEDRDFKMALQISQDPSEQTSEEMRDFLLAMKMSEGEGSSVDLSNGLHWSSDLDTRLRDTLWLYDDDARSKIKKPVRSYEELNDQILLNQLKESSAEPGVQQLTPEELETLRPFLVVQGEDDVLSNVTSDGVKTLDEIEAELTQVQRKKKKTKKTTTTSASPVSGSASPKGFSIPTRTTETGARPKTIQKVRSQSSSRFSPVHYQLSQSPKSQPRSSPLIWSTVSDVNRLDSRYRPIIVDGNNVAYQHGKNDRFSAKGLQIVFDYFSDKFGYSSQDIVIVHKPGGYKSPADNEIIESLYKIDVLIKTVFVLSFKGIFDGNRNFVRCTVEVACLLLDQQP